MIILISGPDGSGKDTVGRIIQSILGWNIKKFATIPVAMYKSLFGIDFHSLSREEKEQERAKFIRFCQLQKFFYGEKVFADALFRDYNKENWIITDLRYKEELQIANKWGTVLHITIKTDEPYILISANMEVISYKWREDSMSSLIQQIKRILYERNITKNIS